jgi:hypothetical protein
MQVVTTLLEQGGQRGGAQGQGSTPAPGPCSAALSAAGGALDLHDGRAKQIRKWLFLLLRFAITRDPDDELAVLMMANSLGWQWGGRVRPSFAVRAKKFARRLRRSTIPGERPFSRNTSGASSILG